MRRQLYILLFSSLFFPFNLAQAKDEIKVEAAALSEIALYPQRTAPAAVVSLNMTGVAAEIPARIEKIAVRVGDIVKKGQLLVKLDCTDYELQRSQSLARLKALEARIELARRRLERTRKLTMKQSVSEELLDERESDLAVLQADRAAAQASLKLTKAQVADCVIGSPFGALVTKRISSVGNYAEVGKPLVQILDIEQLEVSAQVYAQDVKQLEDARDLQFEHDDVFFPVNLRSVLPSINSETRNREVRLLFQNGPALPGAAGKLVWRETRPHVPGNLIVNRGKELGIFILEKNHARFLPLPAAQAGRASPLDLPLSTLIITEGHYSVNNDDAVLVQ